MSIIKVMGRLIKDFIDKIYTTSDIGIGFADLYGNFLDVNKAFLDITGYSKKELIHKKYQDITPKEFHRIDEEVVEILLNKDRTVEYEKELICKDGSHVSLLLNSVCLRNDNGIPYALGATVRQLSKCNFKSRDSIDNENNFPCVYDNNHKTICELNSDFYFVNLDPNSNSILSYRPSDLIGRYIFDYVHPDDLFIVQSIFMHAIRSLSEHHCVLRFRSNQGFWLLRQCYIKPLVSSKGEKSLLINLSNIPESLKLKNKVQLQGEQLKKLDQNLNHRVRDLNILFKVTKAVHQSLDLEEVYRVALDMIIGLDNIDMVFMYLVDKDSKEAVLETYRNIPRDYIKRASRIPKDIGITWKIINSGRVLNVEDIQNNKDVGPAGKKLGHHGVLGVPIEIGDKVIGVLYFASYKNHIFDNNEVRLLSSISDQISVAISKAKLYEELRKKNRTEKIISAITRNVHKSINIDIVLQHAADSIKKYIDNVNNVSIYIINNHEAYLNAYSENFHAEVRLHESFVFKKPGVTWKLLNSRRPVHYRTVHDRRNLLDFVKHASKLNSYLGLPIRHKKHIIGALHITSVKYNAFDIHDIGLFKVLLRQIESAIRNAKMTAALKESEHKYRDLYENVPTGIYRKSYDGQIIMANSTLVHMLGFCSFDEMVSRSEKRSDFLTVLTRDALNKAPTKKSKIKGLESVWTKKDGSKINVIESVREIHDNNGNFLYYEGTLTDITQRKKVENKLKKSRESLRKLTERLEQIREEERTEIAREIHDEFAQLLTGMAIDLALVKKNLSESAYQDSRAQRIDDSINRIAGLVDESFKSVQKICSKLRPQILDEIGLEAAIKWQIDAAKSQSNLDFDFNSNIHDTIPNSRVTTSVFRIFQECLTNIIRHSKASRVTVNLRRGKDYIVLRVKDNGIGITHTSICGTDSLGLLGIRERAHSLNGDVRIKGVPGMGTVVLVRIPCG